jgi:hypothetical protein
MIKRSENDRDGVSSEDRTGFKNVWVLQTGKTKTTPLPKGGKNGFGPSDYRKCEVSGLFGYG